MHPTQARPATRHSDVVLKRLPDGASILIRPIRADDKRMLEDGLRHLSDESVHRRFLTLKRSFSRTELRYLTEVNGRDHVALVAEYPGDAVRRLIAAARFVRHADDPTAAEVAIVVADDWHRRGVGSLMVEQLADEARRAGIERFTATMTSDNVPAQKLMAKLTKHLEQHHAGYGVSEVVLDLAA
jgi:RimJ/RimL family protein N-acetyltransferase